MIFPRSDFHLHSDGVSGKDSPEEFILEAIRRGMKTVGFAESPKRMTQSYRGEIKRCKDLYRGKINVLCGVECTGTSLEIAEKNSFDFRVAVLRELTAENTAFSMDGSKNDLLKTVRIVFAGDVFRLIRLYYETLVQTVLRDECNIVGALDLVENSDSLESLFDKKDPRYRRIAIDAVDALLEKDVIFEISTKDAPNRFYPDAYLLRRIAEKRGRVILVSGSGKKEDLMKEFPTAVIYARACGVGGLCDFAENQFVTKPISK